MNDIEFGLKVAIIFVVVFFCSIITGWKASVAESGSYAGFYSDTDEGHREEIGTGTGIGPGTGAGSSATGAEPIRKYKRQFNSSIGEVNSTDVNDVNDVNDTKSPQRRQRDMSGHVPRPKVAIIVNG